VAVDAERKSNSPGSQTAAAGSRSAAAPAWIIKGLVTQGSHEVAAPGATVVVGIEAAGKASKLVLTTDPEGRFICPLPPGSVSTKFYAYKEGWSLAVNGLWMEGGRNGGNVELRLARPRRCAGMVTDDSVKPPAGAEIQVESVALIPGNLATFMELRPSVLARGPVEKFSRTITDRGGTFSFESLPADSWLRLAVTTADGRHMRVWLGEQGGPTAGTAGLVQGMGYVSMPADTVVKLLAHPAARVQGRVTTKLPGVKVAGLRVMYQGSRPRDGRFCRQMMGRRF
jgi:hypothetical protein